MGIWSRLGKGMLAVAAAATVFAGAAFAAEKKELTVYTALENEQINKYLASFREKYPDIEIKIVRDSTGIVTAKLLAEGEKTPADVVWGTAASSLLVLEDRGMIEPYAPKGLDRVEPARMGRHRRLGDGDNLQHRRSQGEGTSPHQILRRPSPS